jgi:hypothetical protein
VCYAYVCSELIFAMVCLPRALVLPQPCFLRSGYLVAADTSSSSQRLPGRSWILSSSQRLAGRWRTLLPSPSQWLPGYLRMDVVLSAAATWSLVDGCCAFLPVDALPPWLHSPFVDDLLRRCISLGRHSRWAVEVEVPPSCFLAACFVVFLYLSDFTGNPSITCEFFVTMTGPFLRPFLLMKYGYKTRSRKKDGKETTNLAAVSVGDEIRHRRR